MAKISHPFYPIIYVRGYAMTQAEIDDTVASPYMGFNLGATKMRQDWRGKSRRHIFESPLLRLMKEYGYEDGFANGSERTGSLSPRSVIVYRYYEQADSELGHSRAPSVEEAARGLGELILQLREQVAGDDPQAYQDFRVYLVAHSMGGLVCRCLLQNPGVGSAESKGLVDKVFTYGTPHNGIEIGGLNVPSFIGLWDMNNFNRERMAGYLGLPPGTKQVNTLNGHFDPARFFCLVGTNHRDYDVARGLSSMLAGEMSDGLVQVKNAVLQGAPRAYVYRSHSGHYGIVNSEEGYQNLVRFLFADHQVDGTMEVEELPLPPSVRREQARGRTIRASYYFEATVSPRGAVSYKLNERRKETYSAVLRRFDELLRVERVAGLAGPRSPFLFSTFLQTRNITAGKSLVFSVDLAVSATDYEVEQLLFLKQTIPGEYLFRNTVTIRLTASADGLRANYNFSDDSWGEAGGSVVPYDAQGLYIPLQSKKGFRGKLRLAVKPWNRPLPG